MALLVCLGRAEDELDELILEEPEKANQVNSTAKAAEKKEATVKREATEKKDVAEAASKKVESEESAKLEIESEEEEFLEPSELDESGEEKEKVAVMEPNSSVVSGPLDSDPMEGVPPGLTDAMFRVREYDGDIELLTPWGNFVIPGDFGKRFGKYNYSFAIPIRELVPEPPPEEPEEEAQELAEKEEEESETKDESGREITAIPSGNPLVTIDDSDRLIVEANKLYNQRRYYEALTVVDSLLRKVPDNVRAWLMRGSLMMVQGHKDLAVKSYEQALKLNPGDSEVRAILDRYR